MSNSLETDNVTGYSISIESNSSETSVSLSLMRKNEKPIKLVSNENFSDCQLFAIGEVLDML